MAGDEDKDMLWQERDLDVKKDLQDEILNKQRMMKKEYRAVAEEQELYDKYKDTLDPADPNKKRTLWDKVDENANKMIDDNLAGYQEWSNAMMILVHYALNTAKANWYDPIEYTGFLPYRDEIGGAFVSLKDLASDTVLAPVENFIDRRLVAPVAHAFGLSFLDDKDLPNIGFNVSVNERGQLKIELTKNGEPLPETDPLFEKAATGVVAWAKTQDWSFNPANRVLKDSDNKVMTNDKLNQRNADPEQSLTKFMSGRWEIPLAPIAAL